MSAGMVPGDDDRDIDEQSEGDDDAQGAEAAFEKGVRARGEAARALDGELPPGATHEIVEDDEGRQTLRRRRFSAY